jgi:voltage-dependent anion channel protein 2
MTAKVELEDILAAGVKAEFLGTFSPQGGLQKQKGNLFFKNGAFHARAFGEFHPATGNVTTTVDGVVAHEGFVVGGEAGFDVQKAQLTRYAAAFGYHAATYSMAVTATNNLRLFSASYYHKVNEAVEAGVKAAYDTKSKSTVGIEVASKYKIDPTSFAKVCLSPVGVKLTPRSSSSTTEASSRWGTTPRSTRASPLASARRSTRRSSTRLATRYVFFEVWLG